MREIGSTKMAKSNLCKIEFYVPETHLEAVKNAMFETGAGKVGAYDSCAWQTLGDGHFPVRMFNVRHHEDRTVSTELISCNEVQSPDHS